MNKKNKINVLDLISPEMQSVMRFYAENPSPAPLDATYNGMRQAYIEDRKYWNSEAPTMHSIHDIQVPTKYGNILTRIFQPIESPSATLFYLHGGGFILGNLQTHERIMHYWHYIRAVQLLELIIRYPLKHATLKQLRKYPWFISTISKMLNNIISICNKLAVPVTQLARCYLLLLYFGYVIT